MPRNSSKTLPEVPRMRVRAFRRLGVLISDLTSLCNLTVVLLCSVGALLVRVAAVVVTLRMIAAAVNLAPDWGVVQLLATFHRLI
jgi:hypothetical protein